MAKHLTASRTVVIDRPVGDVFALFANPELDPSWRPGVVSMRRLSGDAAGAVYEQRVSGPGGRAVVADITVTQVVPNASITFKAIAGPVRPSGAYTFHTEGTSTRVTFALEAELSGVKALVMAGPVQKSMAAEVESLTRAKEVLEGQR